MTDHFLTRAKAYAVLVGLVVTYLLGQIPADTRAHQILVLVGGLATVVATYALPNKDPRGTHQAESVQPPERGAVDAVFLVAVAVLVVVVLLFFGFHGHH